ncbi:hypothetical protein M0R72_18050, partial [Candidatus Pacearchaeota archaeon]|nr:hypothetical protein [Candidatus Pacearchaeota archaeon]
MTMICRFVDGIDGATLLDLNDEVAYWYLDGSEFPLPDVLYEWVQNALGHGKRLAHWTLDGNTITLKVCIKGSDEQDAYDKLNVLLTRLLRENTLEIRMWGADNSVFYKTYPVTPKLPDWPKKFVIDANYITNITIEIPVDPEVKTSEETLWLIHALGSNDDFETRSGDDFADWEELEVNAGTVTADAANYHSGAVACKLTTTAGGTDSAAIRDPYRSVEELETHGLRVWAKELSGAPALDVDLHCYDDTTPLITKLTHPYDTDKMLMDGTASIKDLVTSTAFTMAGAPTTGALLGATAPDIGAGKYTSCTIPTSITAGQAFTMMFACKTAWQGDDGVMHYLFDNQGTGATQNRIFLRKSDTNYLFFYVYDNASAYRRCFTALLTATTWAANVTHIIVITRSATGVLAGYLDGVPFATPSGGAGTGLETVLGANSYLGTTNAGATPIEGLELPATWGNAITDAALIAALSTLAAWSDLTNITISGVHTGGAAR